MSFCSYFATEPFEIIRPYYNITLDDWLNSIYINYLLLELTKLFSNTIDLYRRFKNKEFGYIRNIINIQNIIAEYSKLYNSKNLIPYLNNYKYYGKMLYDKQIEINKNDKIILLFIITHYELQIKDKILIDAFNKIKKIIEDINTNIFAFDICIILKTNNIHKYYPRIIFDIINFRKYEKIAQDSYNS